MHTGAPIDDVTKVFFDNEQLAESSFRKLWCQVDGKCFSSNAPIDLICGERYRIWSLSRDQLRIAYDPNADQKKENAWWRAIREKVPYERCPVMYGDIVFHVKGHALMWSELILRREIINWLVVRYKHSHEYNFCDIRQT